MSEENKAPENTKKHNNVIVAYKSVMLKVDADIFDDAILMTALREAQKNNPIAFMDLYIAICGDKLDEVNNKLKNSKGRVPMSEVQGLVNAVDKALSKNSK